MLSVKLLAMINRPMLKIYTVDPLAISYSSRYCNIQKCLGDCFVFQGKFHKILKFSCSQPGEKQQTKCNKTKKINPVRIQKGKEKEKRKIVLTGKHSLQEHFVWRSWEILSCSWRGADTMTQPPSGAGRNGQHCCYHSAVPSTGELCWSSSRMTQPSIVLWDSA